MVIFTPTLPLKLLRSLDDCVGLGQHTRDELVVKDCYSCHITIVAQHPCKDVCNCAGGMVLGVAMAAVAKWVRFGVDCFHEWLGEEFVEPGWWGTWPNLMGCATSGDQQAHALSVCAQGCLSYMP